MISFQLFNYSYMKVISIGRSPANDAVIDHPSVSRHHAQLVRRSSGAVTILDVGSRNGTHVNGRRISAETALRRGDIVKLGSAVLPWETYFPAVRPAASFPLWLRAAGGIAAAVAVAALALWALDRQSERDIFFEGEYPPVSQIMVTDNGNEYAELAFEGQLVMFFKENVAVKEARRQIAAMGGKVIAQMPSVYYYLVQTPYGSESNFITQAQKAPQVSYVWLHTPVEQEAIKIHVVDDFTNPDQGRLHGELVSEVSEMCCSYCAIAKTHDIYAGENIPSDRIGYKLEELFLHETDEPLLINLSLGKYLFRYENGKLALDEDGELIKVKWNHATEFEKNIWYEKYRRFLEERINILKHHTHRDFIVAKSAGNNGSSVLDTEIIQPLIDEYTRAGDQKALDVLNNHFLFVSAYSGKLESIESYSDRPSRHHSMVASTDISHLEYRNGVRAVGTSFAAPNALCDIARIIGGDYGLTGKEALQAVKDVTKANADRNSTAGVLDLVDLDRKAREISDLKKMEELRRMEEERAREREAERAREQVAASNYLITSTNVGPIQKGMSVNDVLRIIPNSHVAYKTLADWDGWISDHYYALYINGNYAMALIPGEQNSQTAAIVKIVVVDQRYKTSQGAGVGSGISELLRAHRISKCFQSDYEGGNCNYLTHEIYYGMLLLFDANICFEINSDNLPDRWWERFKNDDPKTLPQNAPVHTVQVNWFVSPEEEIPNATPQIVPFGSTDDLAGTVWEYQYQQGNRAYNNCISKTIEFFHDGTYSYIVYHRNGLTSVIENYYTYDRSQKTVNIGSFRNATLRNGELVIPEGIEKHHFRRIE